MRIALGLDLADRRCAAHAVPAGKAKKSQKEFLDGFNKDFRRVKTDRDELHRMVDVLKDDGNEIHVLIENSTIIHKVYWILVEKGCDVVVAQSADLLRITKSVTKNDDNDAEELAAYMRRRLGGENEFKAVVMAPPEIMARKMFIRAIYVDKTYLADCKKRVRARLKIMGADLKRDYVDISCERSLTQLRDTRDPYLCYEVVVMKQTKARIKDGERYISTLFKDDPYYELLMSIPGFGMEISAYLSTAIIDIGRFDDVKQLEAYTGLVPRQRSSADSDPDCRTTFRRRLGQGVPGVRCQGAHHVGSGLHNNADVPSPQSPREALQESHHRLFEEDGRGDMVGPEERTPVHDGQEHPAAGPRIRRRDRTARIRAVRRGDREEVRRGGLKDMALRTGSGSHRTPRYC